VLAVETSRVSIPTVYFCGCTPLETNQVAFVKEGDAIDDIIPIMNEIPFGKGGVYTLREDGVILIYKSRLFP
jgi:hypothetical protein